MSRTRWLECGASCDQTPNARLSRGIDVVFLRVSITVEETFRPGLYSLVNKLNQIGSLNFPLPVVKVLFSMSLLLRSKLFPAITKRWPTHSTPRRLSTVEVTKTAGSRRHTNDDSVVCLSVGGSTFYTLRSTVESNEVLARHLERAATTEACRLEGKVFIDRDPKHFPFILQYLRDRVDTKGMSAGRLATLKNTFGGKHLALPKDNAALQELYVEASYYKLTELQSTLTSNSTLAGIMHLTSNGNPFAKASQFFSQLRATLLTMGTFGTFGTVAAASKDSNKSWWSGKNKSSKSIS